MPTKRVLHVLSQRPSWTGSGMALNALVAAAEERGYEQRVIIGVPGDDPSPAVANLANDCIHPLVFDTPGLPFAIPGMSDVMPYESTVFSRMTGDQLQQYRAAWTKHLRDVMREFQPDLIHSHHIWILSSLLKDVAADVPVVTHCHATGLRQMSLCPHLAKSVQTGCARNDAFVVLHREHAQRLTDLLNMERDKISIVGSGYRDDVFHARGREVTAAPLIAYAGKLSRAKGLPQLLDVMEQLQETQPTAVLQIAGTGAGREADEIRARVAELANVELLGQIDQSQLAELFRRATVFVLPSFYEGLPLVLVEAAACGCQLVATQLAGIVEQLQPVLAERLELVPLPAMATIDQPVAAALPQFVNHLRKSILVALSKSNDGLSPDNQLQSMTWRGVFKRIEDVWNTLFRKA